MRPDFHAADSGDFPAQGLTMRAGRITMTIAARDADVKEVEGHAHADEGRDPN